LPLPVLMERQRVDHQAQTRTTCCRACPTLWARFK